MTDFTPTPAPAVPSVAVLNTASAVRFILAALVGFLLTKLGVKLGIHLTADQQTQFLDWATPVAISLGTAAWVWWKNRKTKTTVEQAIAAPAPKS